MIKNLPNTGKKNEVGILKFQMQTYLSVGLI